MSHEKVRIGIYNDLDLIKKISPSDCESLLKIGQSTDFNETNLHLLTPTNKQVAVFQSLKEVEEFVLAC